jgi:hypothetical protein
MEGQGGRGQFWRRVEAMPGLEPGDLLPLYLDINLPAAPGDLLQVISVLDHFNPRHQSISPAGCATAQL